MANNFNDNEDYNLQTISNILHGNSNIFNEPFYEQEYWIQCQAVLTLFTVFAFYVFICVLRYATAKTSAHTRDASGKQGRRLYIMLVVASGFTLLRFISDHVVAFTSYINDQFCFTTIAVSTVLYAFGLISVYVFLWMRQSIFYTNPVLAKILNKAVTFASWSTLVVMLLSGVTITVLYNLPQVNGWDYRVTEEGCKGLLTGNDEIVAAIATALTVYFQITLLALFLYPLLSRKTQRYRSASAQNGKNPVKTIQSSVSNTDDNLTDGDISSSVQSTKSKFKTFSGKMKHSDYPPFTENESGIDVGTPSDSGKNSDSSLNVIENSQNVEDSSKTKQDIFEKANGKTNKYSNRQKRPSIFASTPKFLKSSHLFYKRNQARVTTPQSPIAKRSRAKTVSAVLSNAEDCGSGKEQKSTEGKQQKSKRRAKRTQQGRRMMAYLRKSVYIMIVCVLTDVACTVVQARVDVPELVYLVIFDSNLMINVICIIMSFRDWDLILFPMCARFSRRNNKSVRESSNGNIRPNLKAAQRRAEVLRSVYSRHSDNAQSPKPDTKDITSSYNTLQETNLSTHPGNSTPKTTDNSHQENHDLKTIL